MVDVRELIRYNEDVRRRYLAALAKLPWDEFVRNREASWHSMRNIFIHTLQAVEYWLDFLQGERRREGRRFEDYDNMDKVQAYMAHVEGRMREYLGTAGSDNLGKMYTVTNDAGETIQVSAEDVLIHVFEEEVHHRGELIALMWQMDVEPPLMGWKYL